MADKKHYRLFLASPGDVNDVRDAAEKVVKDLNISEKHGIHIDVIRWEDYDTPGFGRPQQVIFNNTLFEKTDLFVGILWSRTGTPSGKINPQTGKAYSGTLEEIDAALKLRQEGQISTTRFMLYFCSKPIPQDALIQSVKVDQFLKDLDRAKTILYKQFESVNQFKYEFRKNLEAAVKDLPLPSVRPSSVPFAETSNLGPIIFKKCNRVPQINDFWGFFQKSIKEQPKQPQFYFIHGEEQEGHESFIDRLMRTSAPPVSNRRRPKRRKASTTMVRI